MQHITARLIEKRSNGQTINHLYGVHLMCVSVYACVCVFGVELSISSFQCVGLSMFRCVCMCIDWRLFSCARAHPSCRSRVFVISHCGSKRTQLVVFGGVGGLLVRDRVLGTGRSPVAGVGRVQRVLFEKRRVVLWCLVRWGLVGWLVGLGARVDWLFEGVVGERAHFCFGVEQNREVRHREN